VRHAGRRRPLRQPPLPVLLARTRRDLQLAADRQRDGAERQLDVVVDHPDEHEHDLVVQARAQHERAPAPRGPGQELEVRHRRDVARRADLAQAPAVEAGTQLRRIHPRQRRQEGVAAIRSGVVDAAIQVEPDRRGLHDRLHHVGPAVERLELAEEPQDALQAPDTLGPARQLPRSHQVVLEDAPRQQPHGLKILRVVLPRGRPPRVTSTRPLISRSSRRGWIATGIASARFRRGSRRCAGRRRTAPGRRARPRRPRTPPGAPAARDAATCRALRSTPPAGTGGGRGARRQILKS
jgi:hypothetical protein